MKATLIKVRALGLNAHDVLPVEMYADARKKQRR